MPPGTATNAMCTFLAINTQLRPVDPRHRRGSLPPRGAARAHLDHRDGTGGHDLFLHHRDRFGQITAAPADVRPASRDFSSNAFSSAPPTSLRFGFNKAPHPLEESAASSLCGGLCRSHLADDVPFNRHDFPPLSVIRSLSLVAIPFLLGFFPLYAVLRGVAVYEEFIEGAKEGIQVRLRIFPYLVAILVAVGVFRAAGGIDVLTRLLAPVLEPDRDYRHKSCPGAGRVP